MKRKIQEYDKIRQEIESLIQKDLVAEEADAAEVALETLKKHFQS